MTQYNIAVVGVTGAVGTRMLEQLEESTLPIETVRALASKRSAGKIVEFKGQELVVEELTEDSFENIDIALFSAGGSVSEKYAPYAVKAGAVVVDNTSFFRQNPNVPLVVPEVNAHALEKHNGIIACPNCSTIQMMVALEPIRQAYGLERVIVSTYQAVSGAGQSAINETNRELQEALDGKALTELSAEILPSAGDKKHYPIAYNALAQIDVFTDNDYTYEEMKMTNETKKIMGR
jgi:aspartate-semialdehyde dehydrogenase